MTFTNEFASKAAAAFGAVAITATLLFSSFANPATTTFTGILA